MTDDTVSYGLMRRLAKRALVEGMPARPGTPETDADPQNPNMPATSEQPEAYMVPGSPSQPDTK